MYTLDINNLKKQGIVYAIVSVAVFVFGMIYELFSHQVYSVFMLGAFAIPLIFGCGVSFLVFHFKMKINRACANLYNASVATFTVYSIIRGILEIYGTENHLLKQYIIVGSVLMIGSFLCNIFGHKNLEREAENGRVF